MTVHTAIVNASEVSAKSKKFHLSEEIRMIGECVLERAMPLAGFTHEDAPAFFQYLRADDSGIVSKIRYTNLTFEDCLDCFMVAVGA
jgi:hypothetical protein